MPPRKKDKAAAAAEKGTMTLKLGDKTLPVPSYDDLTLTETFAILNGTNVKAEVLWKVDFGQPIGRATLTAWWWVARSREAGVMVPLSLVDGELNEAADRGEKLVIGMSDDGGDSPEA